MGRTQNSVFSEDVLIPHFGINDDLVGVEIGVSGGSGSVGMLSRLPKLKLFCIDPWKHFDGSLFEGGLPQEAHDIGYREAVSKLSVYGERVIIIRETSDKAIDLIPWGVDFVFIDGEHDYFQVLNDINRYITKVRPGGIISGHDYGQAPGVTQAVDEFFEKDEIRKAEDFIWWVKI